MSTNYTCNQFDKAYKPTRLGNWEVPKWHLNRPKGRSTITKVIANDRGHLLPGVQKTDQKHWAGLYLGTYHLPKRISKEIAIELSNPKCQTWMKRSYHHPFIDRSEQSKNDNNKLVNINMKKTSLMNEETDRDSIKSIKSAGSNLPVASVAASNDLTTRNSVSASGPLNSTLPNEKSDGGRVKTPSSPALSRISAAASGHQNDENAQHTTVDEESHPVPTRRCRDTQKHHGLPDTIEDAVYRSLQTKRHKHPGLGLNGCWPKCSAVAYKSFNDPGPTQCSKLRVYRPKTSSSSSNYGEKKTCVQQHANNDGKNTRPKTCVPVMTARQLTDIKLALCWDLDAPFDRSRPPPQPVDKPAVFHKVQQQPWENEFGGSGERKQQNSSAVMGFVSAAPASETGDGNENNASETRQTQNNQCLTKNRNLSAVMELIANKERIKPAEMVAEQNNGNVDQTLQTTKPSSSSSSSSVNRSKIESDDDEKRDDGKLNNNNDTDQNKLNDNDYDTDVDKRKRRQQQQSLVDISSDRHYSQDIAATKEKETNNYYHQQQQQQQQQRKQQQRHVFRSCLACDEPMISGHHKKVHDECNHYKMAFKAGVPVSTPVKNRATAVSKPIKYLRVPKPKTTNSDKKKYVIGTLLPPFSMWPGTTARDYPEHWRLTSVYRQAFKPLELRKQPLLQTIYL